MPTLPYRDYASYLSQRFPGRKMQKITINAGFSCPNRDGTIGRGGCIYCNNASFSPTIVSGKDIESQIENGKEFFRHKYPQMRYIAYFQSYTNTHGTLKEITDLYHRAVAVDGIDGLIIGTRPDCIDYPLLEILAEINREKPVIIEYGAESSHDTTLKLINRCHTWQQTVKAVEMTQQAGIDVGLHFIMGLPGESREMMMQTIDCINLLQPDTVKFHQLQIIRNTPLAEMWQNKTIEVNPFSLDDYLDLCVDIVKRLSPDIAIERFTSSAPSGLLLAPAWGIKNYEFTHRLIKRLSAGVTT